MSQPPPQADIQLPPHDPWQPQPEPPQHGIPNWVLVVLAAVFTAAAVGTWVARPESAAEAAVRSFLENVHSGEAESALERLSDPPSIRSLSAEVLDPAWEITEVAQVAHDAESAEVYAEIEAFDGTRLGHRYTVDLSGDEPLILDGTTRPMLVNVEEAIEINGVTDLGTEVALLPGVYRFYESTPATLDVVVPPVLVLGTDVIELGGDTVDDRPGRPHPELTDEGRAALESSLRGYLDACAETRESSCPLGLNMAQDRVTEADPDRPWRITEYPTVVIDDLFSIIGMRLETATPGEAEFDAVVDGTATTLACPIWADTLAILVDWDTGAVTIGESGDMARCDEFTEAE
ncbi:hypothetical protein [Glycomyces salinus]|uniref:hypothetical protein n=1 Tax=Glycomyces salinus TaxID=980294 RepID=UPI0018EE2972|nr:hypothetical protein [Glycomyces salinus]